MHILKKNLLEQVCGGFNPSFMGDCAAAFGSIDCYIDDNPCLSNEEVVNFIMTEYTGLFSTEQMATQYVEVQRAW